MTRNRKFIFGFILVFSLFSVCSFFIEGASISQSWLENSTFDTSDGWFFNIEGDQNDVNGTIENGFAKLSILGEKGNKTFFENGTSWEIRPNSEGMTPPDDYNNDNNGWWASHTWDDFEPQLLKIQWEKNFTMDVNMSDYEITSASFETWINATVIAEDANGGGLDCINDTLEILDMGNGDYIRFFVLISDSARNREFELTSFQTKELGCDNPPKTNLNGTRLIPLSEETLKFYLDEVLKYDSYNFSLTVGFLLWCEDNYNSQDRDYFSDIYMNNLNLSISYEKKIDQLTKISLKQVSESISGENIKITKANLSFGLNFSQAQSFNSRVSELIIKINDNNYIEKTTKLIDIDSIFQEFNEGGLNVKNYIQKDDPISVSFEIFLKEDFQLNESATIFIDNVYLYIDIEEVVTRDWTPLIILLTIGIITAIIIFGSYNSYFKYSVIERKLRKLRKKIKKDRKLKRISSIRSKSKIGQSRYNKRIEILNLDEVGPNIKNSKIKKKNLYVFIWILFIFACPITNYFTIFNDNYNSQINLSSEFISQQWLKNNDFSNQEDWFKIYGLRGNNITLNTDIGNGSANFFILGEKENFNVCSGVPNNTLTSNAWYNTTNPQIVAKPTRGYKINESGCYASHEWEEYMYNEFEVNARQNTAIQWDKRINVPQDMSNFIITNASFKLKVNATVSAPSGEYSGGYDGLDIIAVNETTGTTENNPFDIGDYLKFYVVLSNTKKNISYKVVEFIPSDLGNDNAGEYDYLFDTLIEPEDLDNFIFSLTQVLKSDNHNFTLTLGMEFYCEDDWGTDWDNFDEVYIKECNFSFTYRKLIPKYSSVSLNQITDKFPGDNVEILDAKVRFNYSINHPWPENLSPFSEMRISINNNTLPRTILLKDFNTTIQDLEFNVKPYIVKNKTIYFSLEIFMGNTFNYDENISISIDQVDLLISYRYNEQAPDLLPLAIGLTIGLMGILIGIGAYQLYFKYPPLVRKIRKLKRKIRKNKKTKIVTLKNYNEK
ncbi:MAG: hypothetical protein EU547_07615, partial [Promethearchaeota archaeon]